MEEQNKKPVEDKKEISLMEMLGGSIRLRDSDEILQRKVKKFGGSAHVIIPAKHIGKECSVTIYSKEQKEEDKKDK